MQPMLSRSTLEELARGAGPWVTILSPLGGGGAVARKEDPLRYRNLVRAVGEQLDARADLRPGGTGATMLERLRAVGRDHAVFSAGAPGLVVFANPQGVRLWHLPETVQAEAVVDERPRLEPLLPIVTDPAHFYIVSLTLHGTRLWSADRHGARALPLPSDAPARLEDAAGWDVEEQHLQYHDMRPGPGRASAGTHPLFHAHGGGDDDRSVDVEKYLRAIDRALARAIPHPEAPVVLACDPAVEGIFRQVSALPTLVRPALHGNHHRADDGTIHRAAWPLVAPRFQRAEGEARRRFQELRGSGRTADRVEDVVLAAREGRVEALFLRAAARVEGLFDEATWRVHLEGELDRPTTDLLDRAATDTFLGRGRVFVVPAERMPEGVDPVGAILRY